MYGSYGYSCISTLFKPHVKTSMFLDHSGPQSELKLVDVVGCLGVQVAARAKYGEISQVFFLCWLLLMEGIFRSWDLPRVSLTGPNCDLKGFPNWDLPSFPNWDPPSGWTLVMFSLVMFLGGCVGFGPSKDRNFSERNPKNPPRMAILRSWPFLGVMRWWFCDPLNGFCDLQLGDEKVTLNHLALQHFRVLCVPLPQKKNTPRLKPKTF